MAAWTSAASVGALVAADAEARAAGDPIGQPVVALAWESDDGARCLDREGFVSSVESTAGRTVSRPSRAGGYGLAHPDQP